jgi:DNA-binding NarL/FixJ family response regulator
MDELWMNSIFSVKCDVLCGYNNRTLFLSKLQKESGHLNKYFAQKLTKRQEQVTPLLEAGLSNRQIADRLNISERAVTYHISSIRKRLGVSSRSQLIALLVRKRSQHHNGDSD